MCPICQYGNTYCVLVDFEPIGEPLPGRSTPPGGEDDDFYPPYILKNSPELYNWAANNPYGWKKPSPSAAVVDTPEGHFYAQQGDVDGLKNLQKKNPSLLHKADRNGWQPLHEAARSGSVEAIRLLVDFGADKNARTHGGMGMTPLNIALENFEGKKNKESSYFISCGIFLHLFLTF